MSDESRRAKPNFNISLDTGEEIIEPSRSEKLLGGIIGQNLKFTDHIQNDKEALLKVLNKRLFALRKLAYLTSFKSRKMIANGLIMSKMLYLIPLWAGTEKYLLNSLQLIQNKAYCYKKGKAYASEGDAEGVRMAERGATRGIPLASYNLQNIHDKVASLPVP